MVTRRWLRGVALLPLVAACQLIAPVPDIELAPEAPPGDASAPDAFIPTPDAGTGPKGDGAVPPDGTFCSRYAEPTFCDDFDRAAVVFPAPWDSKQTQQGTLSVDARKAVSSPSSLLTLVPAGSANNNRNYVTKILPEKQSSMRVATDVLVENSNSAGFAEVVTITLVPPPTGYKEYLCGLNVTPSGAVNLEHYANPESGSSVFPWEPAAIRFAVWGRVELEMVLGANPACNLYDANRTKLASIETLVPVTSLGAEVRVGIPDAFTSSAPTVAAWQVRHDDVVITTSP